MLLYLDAGSHSLRNKNESCLVFTPDTEHETAHGFLLAIANGIADRPSPETAASDSLKILSEHYYAAPENWGLKHALQESIASANQSLLVTGEHGRAAAVSALVLKRRRWAAAHVGHTRLWLIRDSKIKLVTRDHVTPRVRGTPLIDRACGLAPGIETDFYSGELNEGDVFVLTNPASHDAVTSSEILACVMTDISAAQIAVMIVDRASKSSADAVPSACVVRVERVPDETREDLEEDVAALPAIPAPAVGETIDGFRIERLMHKSSRFRLYRAMDMQSGDIVALKFPNPRDATDPGFAERFLHEEWIGRRVTSAHLLRALPLKKGRRTVLYSVMAYTSGESLARRLARKGTLSLREVAFIGGQLLEALAQLHDQGIIHNDIRPKNIVLDAKSRNVMLLGLGASHVPHTDNPDDSTPNSRRGTFLAPELFERNTEPTIRSDIFAAGVTLYRMLTGSYPYGKVTSATWGPHGDYVSALHYRHDIPEEVDLILRRACSLKSNERFESTQEFAEAFEAAMEDGTLAVTPPTRSGAPRRMWEFLAIVALLLMLLAYVFIVVTGQK